MRTFVSKILDPSVHEDSKGVSKLLSFLFTRSGGFKYLSRKRAAPRYVM